MSYHVAKDPKPPSGAEPVDEPGLDPNLRSQIMSYRAPDRREAEPEERVDVPKRRRDDTPDSDAD